MEKQKTSNSLKAGPQAAYSYTTEPMVTKPCIWTQSRYEEWNRIWDTEISHKTPST